MYYCDMTDRLERLVSTPASTHKIFARINLLRVGQGLRGVIGENFCKTETAQDGTGAAGGSRACIATHGLVIKVCIQIQIKCQSRPNTLDTFEYVPTTLLLFNSIVYIYFRALRLSHLLCIRSSLTLNLRVPSRTSRSKRRRRRRTWKNWRASSCRFWWSSRSGCFRWWDRLPVHRPRSGLRGNSKVWGINEFVSQFLFTIYILYNRVKILHIRVQTHM